MTAPATDTPTVVRLEPINSERPSGPVRYCPPQVAFGGEDVSHGFIRFQYGPVLENGVNGTSMEVVLKVLIERLEGYQRGPFPCDENEMALDNLKRSLDWLDRRTAARRAQGVEGVNVPHHNHLADGVYLPYRRSAIAELADWHPGFDMTGVSVSEQNREAGSPKLGDKIARNPQNEADRWLVAAEYFAANFEPLR